MRTLWKPIFKKMLRSGLKVRKVPMAQWSRQNLWFRKSLNDWRPKVGNRCLREEEGKGRRKKKTEPDTTPCTVPYPLRGASDSHSWRDWAYQVVTLTLIHSNWYVISQRLFSDGLPLAFSLQYTNGTHRKMSAFLSEWEMITRDYSFQQNESRSKSART